MKKLRSILFWKVSPVIIAVVMFLSVVGIGVSAYVALTATGEVTVEECLSFVGDSTFSVSLYPQESETVQLTIANASSLDMDVDLLSTVTPDPGAKGMTINVPNKVTVPATGQVTVDIVITAGKSAEPTTYTVSIEISR